MAHAKSDEFEPFRFNAFVYSSHGGRTGFQSLNGETGDEVPPLNMPRGDRYELGSGKSSDPSFLRFDSDRSVRFETGIGLGRMEGDGG